MSISQIKGSYANVNGISMYYEIHGEGQPLILIHGGGSTITTSFGKIMPLLARTRMLIAVELQAHGHTTDRDALETFEQDADDVAALMNHLNISRADIMGFSNGGQTAIELAIRHKEKVHALIIASAFYNREGAPKAFWEGFESANFSDMPQVYKDEFLKINNSSESLMNMFKKDVQRMHRFEGWNEEIIKSINAPALIVIGDRDLTLAEHAVAMYRLFPNGRLAILPGTHGSYMGEIMTTEPHSKAPEAFSILVDEFLMEALNKTIS